MDENEAHGIACQAEEGGMAKGENPGIPEQDVEPHREDGKDHHLDGEAIISPNEGDDEGP